MNQEKFGKLIKDIRKKHHLTQKEFADKYNVTYQAVSKWENGKNMPDTFLIKQISEDFHVSLEDLFEGNYRTQKRKKKSLFYFVIGFIFVVLIFLFVYFFFHNHDFQFKTLSTNCEQFNISGNIAYNDSKSAIYINQIRYCGGDDKELYQEIECTLYESNQSFDKKISSNHYKSKDPIKLEDFLKDVSFIIDNYEKNCKEFQDNSLYLSILATNQHDKVITYKIPLKLENCQLP